MNVICVHPGMCTSCPLDLNVSHDIIGVPLLVLQVLRDHYPCINLGFGFRCFCWGLGGIILDGLRFQM